MKLTIGERWHREGQGYVEELTVEGLQSIDHPLPNGREVVPKDGESIIEVRIINSISEEFHFHKISLQNLNKSWERDEASI